ncbi:MAG: cache domain-containing protein [Paludibacterium sp.]|uniref:methyl-accepting chemotaxis protein n=1 Tax=Paludibacterium sp. TaxID=1917523 RepID=UPI0025CD94F0|nr:methyl-accepting chemotaxis protein [Paludibacterium sp.]MBV8048368.1 cache domain-containing protein [Paludibacterium sp.]MBV8647699.1 cache domain-containing protein [Paludibacterium sp.]
MKLHTRLTVLVIVAVAGLLLLAAFAVQQLRQTMLADRQEEIHAVLNLARQQVFAYQALAQSGKLSEAQAQAQALEALSKLRDGKKSYLWARTVGALGLVHPDPRVIGKVDYGKILPNGKTNWQKYLDGLAGSDFAYFIEPTKRPGTEEWVSKMTGVTHVAGWEWIIGFGVWADDIDSAFWSMVWRFVGMGAVIVLLVTSLAVMMSRRIYRQIGGEPAFAAEAAQAIADGDLARPLPDRHGRESLLGAMASMQAGLRQMIEQIQHAAGGLSGGATQLSGQMEAITQASRQSSDATSATASAIEQLSVSIQHISNSARETERMADSVSQRATEGDQLARRAADNIKQVASQMDIASAQVGGLLERSNQIGNIANVIKEIADQTNLLALNAAIEAARAGEMGRGFAVVADEVRKLAERTTQATDQIAGMIGDIQSETGRVVTSMGEVGPRVLDGAGMVEEVASSLRAIAEGMAESLEKVRGVAVATSQQTAASNSVAQNVERIAQMVEASSASVHTAHGAVKSLDDLAASLRQSVSRFRLAG